MRIGFVGMGKLGLPCALAIESKGHEVVGYDPTPTSAEILEKRKYPHMEKWVDKLLSETRISMVTLEELVDFAQIIFVAIQTPHLPKYEGVTRIPEDRVDFNYQFLIDGMYDLCGVIEKKRSRKVVVIISTVLPGTIDRHIRPLLNEYVGLCYNPFFIAMGTTVQDFLNPEFVLLGVDDYDAMEFVQSFYSSIHNKLVVPMSIKSAELTKVAYNTFVGMKIVFANTLMEICHKTGASVDAVTKALMLANERLISPKYMTAGMGDGGGCHPRDNIALSWLAKELDLSYDIFDSIMKCREKQTEFLVDLIEQYAPSKHVLILGKSYKPETDLTVGSPAILLYNILKEKRGYVIEMFDPYIDKEFVVSSNCLVFIATKHEVFKKYRFPFGTVVIDPFRYIPDMEGVDVIRIGEARTV